MAIVQLITEILGGAQVEIAIFIFAIAIHTLLFGKHRFHSVPTKQNKCQSPKQKCISPKLAQDKDHACYEAVQAVKHLALQGAGAAAIEDELHRQFPLISNDVGQADAAIESLTSLLENLGRSATADVLAAVRQVLQKKSIRAQGRLAEALLRICFALHLKDEFKELLGQLDRATDATLGVAMLALRAELATGDIDATLRCIRNFAGQWRGNVGDTPSAGPQGVMRQVVRLAAEKDALVALMQQLCDDHLLTAWTAEALLVECGRRGDVAAMREVEKLASSKSVKLSSVSYCALVQAASSDREVVQLYESHLRIVDVCNDTGVARRIAEAAFRSQRPDIIKQMMASASDSTKQVALLKSFGSDRRMEEAVSILKACPVKTSVLYNTLLAVCSDCGDKSAMERTMEEAKLAGVADVVSYNTVVKAYSMIGESRRAFATMESMAAAGLAPNQVTFNELIDDTIKTDVEGAWGLIDKMGACGLKPNRVTCSILMKTMQHNVRSIDIDRVFALLGSLDEDMDEVLLSSACEACVRMGRADLLSRQLKRQRSSKGVTVVSAHTFGSLIRAHGYVQDTQGAWATWRQMTSRNVVPTSITIGCMVEALVSNGETDAGYDLVRELLGDEATRPLVNAVIYCSVLKGFSHLRRFDRVWEVYKEMRAEKVQFSIVTYNALIDACARSRELSMAETLLTEMAAQNIEPNTVTYSTIIKGYCNDGRLNQAFELLETMKQSKNMRPDEVTYNTVLDGCARQSLFDRGVSLLAMMETDGVPPSNFTLSLLAKLASRSKLPDKAFELCEQLSRKYHIRMNVHVYNNLVQACTGCGDCNRALGVFSQMCKEKVRPDVRTYTLLLRACVSARKVQEASALVRLALGMGGADLSVLGVICASVAQIRGGLPSELICEILDGMATSAGHKDQAFVLLKDLKQVPGLRLDPRFSMRLTSTAIKSSA